MLDGWIPHYHVLSDPAGGRGREYYNAVRITDGGVRLDQIIVARKESDPEVGRRTDRVAISARLVPPERVVTSLDSYASAAKPCGGGAVPHGHVPLDADPK